MKMPKNVYLTNLLETERIKKNRTWNDVAEIAFKKLGINNNGIAFSGSGFQSYVERETGQKKWGRSVNRPVNRDAKVKPETIIKPSMDPNESRLHEVLSSNLSPDTKLHLIGLMKPA